MSTNISEKGFETVFADHLVNDQGYIFKDYNGVNRGDYDLTECVDTVALFDFLAQTQPDELAKLKQNYGVDYQKRFLARLQKEINQQGLLAVLRKGIKDLDCSFKLVYFLPNSGLNLQSQQLWALNSFIVTRQLYYSLQNNNSLDMVILVNGLPIITFELKNLLTGQTVKDSIWQYKNDRSSKEKLFQFERCFVHFAMDTEQVFMTTKLADKATRFLPFNKGYNHGAGNPPVADGMRTSYMWEDVLTKSSLSRILENFIQLEVTEKDGKKNRNLLFPRYHQLDVVRKLLQESKVRGAGQKYLVQHSAGSGKSNSISWLAHQLAGLYGMDGVTNVFDSIIILTDRRVLDKQLGDTIKSFEQTKDLIVRVESGRQLKESLEQGKRIIVSTIQKFPVIVDTIGELAGNKFAIIIDEAHSSTGGETMATVNQTIQADQPEGEEFTDEDVILETLQSRRMLPNVSYFAFTATPKNKTLELFGRPDEEGHPQPFHSYSMKQAIEEGFILDVLTNYTTFKSYYALQATADREKEFVVREANRQLKYFVENHSYPIEHKAKVMLEHFYSQVYLKGLVGGKAKAMLVTNSRKSAIKYHFTFKKLIKERGYSLGIITAFSGDVDLDGNKWNEGNLNNFKSADIPSKFEESNYHILICANKFQTGFDQPLLQTMYVDKKLGGVTAVQTLSRLNRSCKDKEVVFVLDFFNSDEDIKLAFEPYYRTTILSQCSDPNKLHDLKSILDSFGVYTDYQVKDFAVRILKGEPVETLHGLLDSVVEKIKLLPKEDIDKFKDAAKSYIRFYGFISQIINFDVAAFEELYQFLKQLSKKLINLGTKEEILSQSVLDSVDFDSYRNEKKVSQVRIHLSGEESLSPVPTTNPSNKIEDPKDLLENIVSEFNNRFGTDFKDEDKVKQIIDSLSDEIVNSQDMTKTMQDADRSNRRLVLVKLLDQKMADNVDANLELFNNYHDKQGFKEFLTDYIDKLVVEKMKRLI